MNLAAMFFKLIAGLALGLAIAFGINAIKSVNPDPSLSEISGIMAFVSFFANYISKKCEK